MNTNSREVPQAAGFAADESSLAPVLVPLMQMMLGVIGRCRDALLQEDAETLHVLRSTLAHLCGPGSPQAAHGVTWEIVERELDGLLDRILESPDQARPQRALLGLEASRDLPTSPGPWRNLSHQSELAYWFHSLAQLLHDSHPRALEMLRLRFSGLGAREIAVRLNLPFRLVEQVLVDLRQRDVQPPCHQEPVP